MDGDRATRARGFLRSAALRRVVLVVAGLLVGFGVYSTNARMLVNEQLPMPFGVGVATVMSGSMEPTLHVGDLVVVQAQETPGDVAAGDIVVFQDGSSLVVHRVQRVGDGTLVTRGDANAVDDDPIAEGAVKGVVALSIPLLGSVVQVLHTPACMVAVLAVAVVLVELSFRANREGGDVELDALREEIELLRAQAAAGAQGAVPQVESAQAAEGANGAEVVEALEGAQAEAGAQAAAGTQRGQAAGDVEGGRS